MTRLPLSRPAVSRFVFVTLAFAAFAAAGIGCDKKVQEVGRPAPSHTELAAR